MKTLCIKNISKNYSLNSSKSTHDTLRDKIGRFRFFGSRNNKKNDFRALSNFSAEIEAGEIVGVIGQNGAGKSTLLKILSKITPPTSGEITMKGRVSSLLEVGTGFNSELTGRENVFVNGAILGMKRKEIEKKFDEIIDFSGVEKFIDVPVKKYSSGMQVRLAFSVAAHLEPDIMLIDEVLAVGDIHFQEKCLGKIGEVTQKKGRTILFVSHNMNTIKRLCTRCILFDQGRVIIDGKSEEAIEKYLSFGDRQGGFSVDNEQSYVKILKIAINDQDISARNNVESSSSFAFSVFYEQTEDFLKENYLFIEIYDIYGNLLFCVYDIDGDDKYYRIRKKGSYQVTFTFPPNLFNKTSYRLRIGCGIPTKYNSSPDRDKYFQVVDNIWLNFAGTNSFADKYFKGTRGGGMLLKIPSSILRYGD